MRNTSTSMMRTYSASHDKHESCGKATVCIYATKKKKLKEQEEKVIE
jgi:hypothetical protein